MAGNISNESKQYTVNLEVCQKVLERRRNILGDDDPNTLRTRSNIAFLYMQMGKQNESCQMYQDVFEKQNELLEKRMADYAQEKLKREDIEKRMELLKEESARRIELLEKKIAHHAQEEQKQLFTESLSDELKVTGSKIQNENSPLPPTPPIPPAPPLPMNIPPLPPPIAALQKHDVTKKNRPQPSKKLKNFNWSKLPDANMQGTIWNKIDESNWYQNMELALLDNLFSAYEKDSGVIVGQKNRKKVSSVIDYQRALNGSILLRELKMNGKELSKVVISMDSNQELSIDMIEKLLKFTPSVKEKELLNENSSNIDSLNIVERFLYEISMISNYEKRLKSLLYKKRFTKIVDDLSCRIKKVVEASKEVTRSRRLKKLLESVLFLGNYMKPGNSRDARGFRLESLNRLSDTKSSSLKVKTLLHYLVQVLEKQDNDFLQLEKDIPHVREACKESLNEIEKGIELLKIGLEDGLVHLMKEFHEQASLRLAELDGQFKDMKTKFNKAIRFFGDRSIVQPAEFFGIFDAFLNALKKASQDNKNFRERQERLDKLAMQTTELKKRTIDHKFKNSPRSSVSTNVETDDSMSAFRTGAVLRQLRRARTFIERDTGSMSLPRQHLHHGESRERPVLHGEIFR